MTGALTDWVFHLDNHLAAIASSHGALVYAVMFGFIFIETGVVVLPFLPGDSLLFVAGALAAKGVFSLPVLAPALAIAAIAGDTLNFAVGGAMRKHVLDAAAWPGLASCWVPGISSGTCLGSAII